MSENTIELFTDIVKKEGIGHQLIKKLIIAVFKKYGQLRFVKTGSETKIEFELKKIIRKPVDSKNGIEIQKNENINIFAEMEYNFGPDKIFLKPDLTVFDVKNKKPLFIMEIINTSTPSASKYQAYFSAQIDFVLINVRDFSVEEINEWITDNENSYSPLIKAYEIYKGSGDILNKTKKLLSDQTYNKYKYFGYLKEYEDIPFVFNLKNGITNSLDICIKTFPNFDRRKEHPYYYKSNQVPNLVKKTIYLTDSNPMERLIPTHTVMGKTPTYIEVKVEKIIRKYNDPFLVCKIIDSNKNKLNNFFKIGIVYNGEERKLPKNIENLRSIVFKSHSDVYENEKGIKIYSNEISSKQEMKEAKISLGSNLNLKYWKLNDSMEQKV